MEHGAGKKRFHLNLLFCKDSLILEKKEKKQAIKMSQNVNN